MYFLAKSGFLSKVRSVEELRNFVSSMGAYAMLVFTLLQFLQVVILPIPAFVSVGVGVLLFGPFKCAVLSFIGILLGSLTAFYIGRVLGYKTASWIVGKETLDKTLKSVKGKDKVVLTFMFLFPFFPDDILCFVSGLSTMTVKFFTIMISIVRLITVFVSSYAYNNNLIPYDTWWGIILWIVFFIITIISSVIIYKKGNEIEKFFTKYFSKKK